MKHCSSAAHQSFQGNLRAYPSPQLSILPIQIAEGSAADGVNATLFNPITKRNKGAFYSINFNIH